MSDSTRREERWAYAGKRRTRSNGLANAWIPLSEQGLPQDPPLLFPGGSLAIGSVYKVQVSECGDALRLHGSPKIDFDAVALPSDLVLQWAAQTSACKVAHSVEARERKAKAGARERLLLTLKPLRRAYHLARTNTERRAIEVEVLNALRERP